MIPLRRALCLVAILALGYTAACSRVSPSERLAIDAYTTAIQPHAREGGRIVVQLIRPALGDLEAGRTTAEDFRAQAASWKQQVQRVREGFASAPVPSSLRETAKLFDESLRGYVNAIDAFVQASFKTGDELKSAVTAVVPIAERADQTYDRAVALLRKERKRAGLPETTVP